MSAASIVTCDMVADIVREVFDLVRSQYVFAFGLALLLGQAQAGRFIKTHSLLSHERDKLWYNTLYE